MEPFQSNPYYKQNHKDNLPEIEFSREATETFHQPIQPLIKRKLIKPDEELTKIKDYDLPVARSPKKLVKADRAILLRGLSIPEFVKHEEANEPDLPTEYSFPGVNLTEESLKYIAVRKRKKEFNRAVIKNLLPEFDKIALEDSDPDMHDFQMVYNPNNLNYGEGVYLRHRTRNFTSYGNKYEPQVGEAHVDKYGPIAHEDKSRQRTGTGEHEDTMCSIM